MIKKKKLIQNFNGNIYFFTFEPFSKEKEKICDVYVNSKKAFAETNNGKLIVNGYYRTSDCPCTILINPDSKQIEVIYHNYNAMFRKINSRGKYFNVLCVKNNSMYIITPKACIVELDMDSLKFKRFVPVVEDIENFIDNIEIENKVIISLGNNNKLIINKIK